MKERHADRAQVAVLPPAFYLGGLAIGWVLNRLLPAPNLPGSISASGVVLIVVSVMLAVWAAQSLRRAGTPIDVRKSTRRIVRSGPFRISRNPIYLSLLLLVAGIGLVANLFWVLVILPLVVLVVNRAVIAREEEYLERKFGEEYLEYKASVRRWI